MEMKIDRISELPDEIAEDILSRLSTRDAVRTSLLSSKWRYKWTTTTSLVFGDMFLHSEIFSSPEQLVSVIDHVLSHHVGPIHKFTIYCNIRPERDSNLIYEQSCPDHDIDRWILGLSRSHIKELSLGFSTCQHYMLPTCVYTFQNLTKLVLSQCSLTPSETFKGFRNLKILRLSGVALAQDVLEIMLCSPVLEWVHLRVDLGYFVHNINVDAPNLRFFKFVGEFAYITFRNTFHLAVVDILWGKPDLSRPLAFGKMPKFFDHLLHVWRLTLGSGFIECLHLGGLPREYPLRNLEYLSMFVNFHTQENISTVLCLLRSCSSNLQELKIWERNTVVDENVKYPNFIELDAQKNCLFTKLRRVRMNHIVGCKGEIDFINYMLSASPVLEMMTIHPLFPDSKSKVEQSLCLENASEQTKIIVKQPCVKS